MTLRKTKIRLLKKLGAIVAIAKAQGIPKTIHIAPDNEARAVIDHVLRTKLNLSVENAQHGLVIKNAADEILARMKAPPEKPTNEMMMNLLDGVSSQAFWFHAQLAGLTTIWEFRVRFFAQNLGIRSNVPIDEKSKKHRANRSVQHMVLSDVIKEINARTGNRLTLKLLELSELRNAIVHCNPQGIKAYAKPLLGKDAFKKIRGNVIVMKLDGSGQPPRNISDISEEAEIESEDLFGFFLEAFNTELPKRAFKLFEDSTASVDLLTELAVTSFDDRVGTFDALLRDGIWPNDDMVSKFKTYFMSAACPIKRDPEEFFKRLKTCVKT